MVMDFADVPYGPRDVPNNPTLEKSRDHQHRILIGGMMRGVKQGEPMQRRERPA
jgi:hypothetical protein